MRRAGRSGFEAAIDCQNALDAFDHQTRADEQHQRERNLRNH